MSITKGEFDLVMPWQGNALFDSHSASWLVYSAASLTSLQFPMDLRWCCICYPKAV
jgi:hypothetical protein